MTGYSYNWLLTCFPRLLSCYLEFEQCNHIMASWLVAEVCPARAVWLLT